MLAFEDEQEQPEPDDADEFGEEPDACDAGQPLRAREVDGQRQHEQRQSKDEGGVAAEFEPKETCEESRPELRHRGDRDDERADVDPRGHPCVPLAPQTPGPRVDPAGDGELGDDLAEDESHEQLPAGDDDDPPDRWRPAGRQRHCQQRVDADERREVREAEGEVRPGTHRPLERVAIAENGQMVGIGEVATGLSAAGVVNARGILGVREMIGHGDVPSFESSLILC